MTLAALIRKDGLVRAATATPATSAPHAPDRSEIVATVATVAVASPPSDEIARRRWTIRYPDVEPMEVLFTPPASRGEVAKIYPGAEIDMLPEPIQSDATPSEAAELRQLVTLVLADASDAEREEALAVAMNHPEAALRSFRALVNRP